MLLEFCDEKKLCLANTWCQKKHNRKVTFKAGEFATEINFVLFGKQKEIGISRRTERAMVRAMCVPN